jgi:trimethylamine--corrinoid protein Co-methyltransferase
MHSLYSPTSTPGLSVLSPCQIDEILQAAFLIVERTGGIVSHPEMLGILREAGAEVDGERVHVPRNLIQKALDMSPKGLVIYDQSGSQAMLLHGRRSYYGSATASPQTRDALSGEIHETTLEDIERGIKVADYLRDIDFVMPFGSAQDCPTRLAEAWEVLATMKNSSKPIVFCPYSARGAETVVGMCQKVAGGPEELRRKPFAIIYPEPIAPLTWPREVLDYMIIAARNSFPQLVTGAQLMSLTGPVTVAGLLAQAAAESFLSTFMAQCVNPGAPVFMASIPCSVNSRNSLVSMAGPEFQLAIGAWADIARRVGLPSWGCAGVSDSHIIDAQAGAESCMSILFQGLAGVNLIHDVGYLGTGHQCSAAMMVFGAEVVGICRRILKGMTVDDDFLATEIIDRVGPGGSFMTNRHTIRHLRSEVFTNGLFTKIAFDQWTREGAKSSQQLADDEVRRILGTHEPKALTVAQVKELEDFIGSKS